MSAIVEWKSQDFLAEVTNLKGVTDKLMATKHYAKLGPDGCFLVLMAAKAMSMDPFEALNGGLVPVNGKIEMSARSMSAKIRRAGHSLKFDPNNNHEKCTITGTRNDNGDTCTITFTIEDAKRAGLAGKDNWKNYPADMLFSRALSRLARQLFSDVIGGDTYVEGEIKDTLSSHTEESRPLKEGDPEIDITPTPPQYINNEQLIELANVIYKHPAWKELENIILERLSIEELRFIPAETYDTIYAWAVKKKEQYVKSLPAEAVVEVKE